MISLFSEVFADDVNFTQEMECPDNKLTLKCQFKQNRVTTIYYMRIQQKNISELYEDVVTIRYLTLNGTSKIEWHNDTIENISETKGSSINPANESKLVVKIRVKCCESCFDSVMFRCTINGKGLENELNQNLTVRKENIGKFS